MSNIRTYYSPPGPWRTKAACRGMDPALFHAERGERDDQAKAVCAGCPVAQECLVEALSSSDCFGVWGGLSNDQRKTAVRHLGRMRTCRECIEGFHTYNANDIYCGEDCRKAAIHRSKSESYQRRSQVA